MDATVEALELSQRLAGAPVGAMVVHEPSAAYAPLLMQTLALWRAQGLITSWSRDGNYVCLVRGPSEARPTPRSSSKGRTASRLR